MAAWTPHEGHTTSLVARVWTKRATSSELVQGLVVNALMRLVPAKPAEFTRAKAVVEGFESRQVLQHFGGDRLFSHAS